MVGRKRRNCTGLWKRWVNLNEGKREGGKGINIGEGTHAALQGAAGWAKYKNEYSAVKIIIEAEVKTE